MNHRKAFLAAVFLVACDSGAEHGGGHGGGSLEVFVGRAPVVHASAPVVHTEEAAGEEAQAKPEAHAEHAPTPAPPDAGITDGPEGEGEAAAEAEGEAAAEAEGEAEAEAEPEVVPVPAPAAGGKSEEEWAKLANVRVGTLKVEGGLDPEVVKKGVRSNAKPLRECYAKGLVAAPELGGKLTVDFVIDKKGKVESAKVKSTTLSNPAVETCFTDAIGAWTFDAPEDGKNVSVRQAFTLAL